MDVGAIWTALSRELFGVDDALDLARAILVETRQGYVRIGRAFSIIKHDLRAQGIGE